MNFRPTFTAFALLVAALGALAATAAEPPLKESPITDFDREHWAFQPLERPAVPQVKDEAAWVRTPIDAFILAKLERRSLAPRPEAERAVLLRRASFSLTGLPPTPEERAAFVADDAPGAYERQVERLLASPHFGEHAAQRWLDLARFAETDGFEHDRVRPEAWKYRDWVIRALNDDLPYDRFVAWQLAGDELAPNNTDAATATMFCLAGPDMPDVNSQELRKHNLLNEMAGTVSSVFMALQFGCAQCHDHKYDPISQGDFFRLRSFFEPAVSVKRDKLVSVLKENSRDAGKSYFYVRGELTRPSSEITPAFPRVVNADGREVPAPPENARSSHRRAALAEWLTDRRHPLTARVIANRIWQQHFGRGLSNTPSDFGLVGEEPSHAELLDWLAVELIESGWSLKHLHRLIVTSAVYRQQSFSRASTTADEAPPDADLYAVYPRRRLEAEAVRDAMLLASGQLNRAAGGPGVRPPLPAEVTITLLKDQWQVSPDEADHVRRSIYIFARRNLRYPLLEAFDRADANATCAARHVSTTAPQALLMLNSEFSLRCAEHLAGEALTASDGQIAGAIDAAFVRCYARQPSDTERARLRDFLAAQAKHLSEERAKRPGDQFARPHPATAARDLSFNEAAALVDICLALLNTSEFVYVD